MPEHLERLQYREDSIRARKWFEMTRDSSYIEKYVGIKNKKNPEKKKETPLKNKHSDKLAILPNEKTYNKNRPFSLIYT